MRFLRRVLNIYETPLLPPPASSFSFLLFQTIVYGLLKMHSHFFVIVLFSNRVPNLYFSMHVLCVPGGEEIGGISSEEGKTMATSKMDNMTCRSKECVGKPLQVVATQLPYVFRYLANELFAMNIRMNLTVSST